MTYVRFFIWYAVSNCQSGQVSGGIVWASLFMKSLSHVQCQSFMQIIPIWIWDHTRKLYRDPLYYWTKLDFHDASTLYYSVFILFLIINLLKYHGQGRRSFLTTVKLVQWSHFYLVNCNAIIPRSVNTRFGADFKILSFLQDYLQLFKGLIKLALWIPTGSNA